MYQDEWIPIVSTTIEYRLEADVLYRAVGQDGDLQVEYQYPDSNGWNLLNDTTFDYYVGALIWHYENTAEYAWTMKDYYAAACVCTEAGYVLPESDLVRICEIKSNWGDGPASHDVCMRNLRNFHNKTTIFHEGSD